MENKYNDSKFNDFVIEISVEYNNVIIMRGKIQNFEVTNKNRLFYIYFIISDI